MQNLFMEVQKALTKEDLIPLTPESFDLLSGVDETYDEIKEYLETEGLSIHNVYQAKTGLYSFWYIDQYVYMSMPTLSLELLKTFHFPERIIAQREALDKFLDKGQYSNFFSLVDKQFSFVVFNELYDELPKEERYQIFRDLYVRNEYGFDTIPKNRMEELLEGNRGRANLEGLDFKDTYITIYRGQQDLSTQIDEAYSWTTDRSVAEMFASRYKSEVMEVYQARVHHDNILDYITDRGESEILLYPKDLKDIELLPTISFDEELMELFQQEGYLDDYGHFSRSIQDDWFHDPEGIHGVLHIKRVLLHTLLITYHEGLSEQDKLVLAYASIYHDIGRVNDDYDPNHGKESVNKKRTLQLSTEGLTKEDNRILDFIIEYHAKSDAQGGRRLKKMGIKDKQRALSLYRYFKDSDGLDRVRLKDLDSKYLRTDIAKRMTLLAQQLLQNIR